MDPLGRSRWRGRSSRWARAAGRGGGGRRVVGAAGGAVPSGGAVAGRGAGDLERRRPLLGDSSAIGLHGYHVVDAGAAFEDL